VDDEESVPIAGGEQQGSGGWRRTTRRGLSSREASWLASSWNAWEQRLEEWIAEHKPTPEDAIALRQLWLEEAKHYDWLWRRYRVYHRLLRVTLIIAGVLTPLLVQAGATTLATVSGAITGVSAGLDGFFNWGERVQTQRRTADRLKDEGTAFLTKQQPYGADDKANLEAFKNQLAAITKGHRRDYDVARAERGGVKRAG
jgi:hypothetical protein